MKTIKRIFSITIILFIAISLFSLPAFASEEPSGYLFEEISLPPEDLSDVIVEMTDEEENMQEPVSTENEEQKTEYSPETDEETFLSNQENLIFDDSLLIFGETSLPDENLPDVTVEMTDGEEKTPEYVDTENEEQKTEYSPEKDEDTLAAEKFIKSVMDLGFITLDDEIAVYDAMVAYESLSDLAKDMVADAKRRLDEAMSIIRYLKSEEEKLIQSEARIAEIIEKTEYIYTITKEDGHDVLLDEILLLEEKYAALSDEEKLILDERLLMNEKEDYNTFINAIKDTYHLRLREYDEMFVSPVSEKLSAIRQLTFSDGYDALKASADEFICMYDSLSDSQKELFMEENGFYDDIISSINDDLLIWQTASDTEKLTMLLRQIAELEKVTPEHEDIITTAQKACLLITDENIIPPELLDSLENAVISLEKALSDKSVAEGVCFIIENIGDITLDSASALESARVSYDNLTDEQKTYVSNYEDLLSKEAEFSLLLKEKAEADDIVLQIDSIEDISLETEPQIIALRERIDALSEKGKNFITNIEKFISVEKTVADMKAAEEVDNMIALIGEVSVGKLDDIHSARERYDALTDEQRSYVKNISILTEAEAVLKDHIAANKVDKIIAKLPSKATFAKEDSILSAKSAYDALTDEQKLLLKDPDKLLAVYDDIIRMQRKVKKYIDEFGSSSVYIDDTTGYINITASIEDFLTDEDKDLIAAGKSILYTITALCEEFSYEDVNVSILPTEEEEVVFSPFYYIYISRAVADVDENGIISDNSFESIKEIPGSITVEIVLSEDLLPQTTEITRIFTGLISPASEVGNFARIMDMDMNMNTMTFTINGSSNIIPSFIDIMNPMTGDDATIYIIFAAFAVIIIALIIFRKKKS